MELQSFTTFNFLSDKSKIFLVLLLEAFFVSNMFSKVFIKVNHFEVNRRGKYSLSRIAN